MPTFQSFRGRQYFAPAVIVDVKNELVAPPPLGKSIAIFGDFPQLESQKVHTFSQSGAYTIEELFPKVAKLNNYAKFWKTSGQDVTGQANAISFVNCGTNTQAQKIHQDESAANSAIFYSRLWGVFGNSVTYTLLGPTELPAELDEEGPNYYKISMTAPGFDATSLQYKFGSSAQLQFSCDAAVSELSIEDGVFTYTPTGASQQTLNLIDYADMDSFKDAFDALSHGTSLTQLSILAYDVKPIELDEIDTSISLDGSLSLYAHSKALEHGLEGLGAAPIYVEFNAGTYAKRYRLLDTASGALILTGGTQSSATSANYLSVFSDADMIAKDFTSIACESTSATVHGYVKNYLNESEISQKERNAWLAAPADSSIDTIYSSYVLPLNDKRISVVGQSITYLNYLGQETSGGPEVLAVLLCALQGALPIAQPLTSQVPSLIDTEEVWSREGAGVADSLVRKGITALKLNLNNEIAVIRSVTSYLKDNLLQNCEVSSRESIDASVRDMRVYLSSELGTTISSSSKDKLKNLAEKRLKLHVDRGIIKAYNNVKVRVQGDVAYVDYDVALTNPLNFIRITANVVAN